MADSSSDEERKFWKIDPELFHLSTKPGKIVLLLERLRPLGSLLLIGLAASYPLILVYLGLEYGGLVFWGSFLASLAIIYAGITWLGYAGNFERRGPPFLKTLVVLVLGFGLAGSFYLSLFNLRLLTVPIVIGLGVLGLAYYLRK